MSRKLGRCISAWYKFYVKTTRRSLILPVIARMCTPSHPKYYRQCTSGRFGDALVLSFGYVYGYGKAAPVGWHAKLSCLPSESDNDDHFRNVLMWNHHITPHKHRSSFLRCIQRKKRHLHQIIIWQETTLLFDASSDSGICQHRVWNAQIGHTKRK
jgi:hypothetical protein